ncbi:hypothetical protein AN640_05620 [Candidatus Epulonipiscium fishelsonii]|uniref:Uncharacterized protein n=1 Tax=Candidatus Epulonipiscium fishelsonii TaxID=77094 RepID=A0ACC8XID2_9FIRM|nr:hypothetical protein AN640_05620 [Epulopiscium sp. SCG-D08WGA-EpuloA1]
MIILFCYDFPHKKTQDYIYRLLTENIIIDCVIAAPFISISKPNSLIRTKMKHISLIHPKDICQRFNIPYYVIKHNSNECIEKIKFYQGKIGLISGARILDRLVIQAFCKGIINIHPGILPQNRGLDTLKWAIIENLPIGVTSHLIDENIDEGKLIIREEISLYKDDTILDINLRLEELQLNILGKSIQIVKENNRFESLSSNYPNRGIMPKELEKDVLRKLSNRLSKLI